MVVKWVLNEAPGHWKNTGHQMKCSKWLYHRLHLLIRYDPDMQKGCIVIWSRLRIGNSGLFNLMTNFHCIHYFRVSWKGIILRACQHPMVHHYHIEVVVLQVKGMLLERWVTPLNASYFLVQGIPRYGYLNDFVV